MKRTNALLTPRSVLNEKRRAELAATAHNWCSDDRRLIVAAELVCREGGDAAGIDGVRPSDLSREMMPVLARQLRNQLRSGKYQPAPARRIEIAKADGHGLRTVEIPSIRDRIVGVAAAKVLSRFFEPQFDHRSYGFRPKRNRTLSLAELLAVSDAETRRHWLVDDLVDAFGSVPLPRLWQILQARLPGGDKFVSMIRAIIGRDRKRGLPQGHPLSPLLLNIYLDHILDRWWRKMYPEVPLLRTADDLAILCRTRREADQIYPHLVQRLQGAGFGLHGTNAPHQFDIQKEKVEYLGFDVQHNSCAWQITLPASLMQRVRRRIKQLPAPPDGLVDAKRGVEGLISQLGPAYSDVNRMMFCEQIISDLTAAGLHAAVSDQRIQELWQAAWMRWRATLNRRRRHHGDDESA